MIQFKVTGMACGHCVQAVEKSVRAVAPEAHVKVDLSKGEVTVDGQADPVQVRDAIVDAGYKAANMAANP